MRTYFSFLVIFVGFLSLISCQKQSEYLIEKGKVGKVDLETTVKDLADIYAKDSLVVELSEMEVTDVENQKKYFRDEDKYKVYSKEGKHLLTITPIKQHDSLSKIKSVEIFSNQYKTKKGVSLYSPFKEIRAAYPVSITNTLLSAHIDIDELNATMSIDKEEIGINDFNRDHINANQIPDLVQVKHFTVWFN